MEKIKKAYVGSRFRTRGSNSDSGFEFELKEALDLPMMQYVISMTYQSHTHGEQLDHITTDFT